MKIIHLTELTDEIYEAFQRLIPQLTSLAPPSRKELQDLIDADATNLFITCDADEKIVATVTLTCFRVPTGVRAIIEDLVVDAEARGQGAATKLTQACLDLSKEYGAKGVMLTSNPRRLSANQLYQKMGFKRWETNLYFYEF
ncbi:MAG: GNAT family N-acetyltransferase [Anaerolineae bacterium]|jgi:N-acetylglutamate synthase-like GNAT family acetyltransferase|nr:GNAT family N-acetyltransferase [Anaerolineae bacterium]MBT7075009.1 GNAT family N-acetyltransferase [Anaerolineae bacterium]MBT7782950.1 GNAT family N-acetyltransferase [Anaerolineae bacterium]